MGARKCNGLDDSRRQRRESQLRAKAVMMGAPGNVVLAAYIERLESRIRELETLVANNGMR